ncbi:hypothetical protein J6590_107811, partial [Homalodisca vitripennis]
LLIRRHSELSATDWDTGILTRFITPPPSHPLHTRCAAPPVSPSGHGMATPAGAQAHVAL